MLQTKCTCTVKTKQIVSYKVLNDMFRLININTTFFAKLKAYFKLLSYPFFLTPKNTKNTPKQYLYTCTVIIGRVTIVIFMNDHFHFYIIQKGRNILREFRKYETR